MPAPLAVDREQVRMLVLTVGVAEAARQTGIDLSTVKQWSARGKWLQDLRDAQVPPPLPLSMQPRVVTGVTSPADALAATLLDDSKATRIAASRFSRKAIEHAAYIAETSPDEALAMSQDVKNAVSVAVQSQPGWTKQDTGVSLSLFQVAGDMSLDMRSVTVTGEVTE